MAVVVSQSEGCSGQDRLISNHESIQLQTHIQTHRQVILSIDKSVQYRGHIASILELDAGQTFTVSQSSGLKKNVSVNIENNINSRTIIKKERTIR